MAPEVGSKNDFEDSESKETIWVRPKTLAAAVAVVLPLILWPRLEWLYLALALILLFLESACVKKEAECKELEGYREKLEESAKEVEEEMVRSEDSGSRLQPDPCNPPVAEDSG
ncbi:unnamed protein product [Durusdinium trenchii]|uniref:Uncharacterized protein n=1 Tax=Durusdinium trenchii TaxID=1381693 RepID=A0ABP0SXN8_9DINO